jgi:hypothetical protein
VTEAEMGEMKKRIRPTAGKGIKQMQNEIKLQYYTNMLDKKMKEDIYGTAKAGEDQTENERSEAPRREETCQ